MYLYNISVIVEEQAHEDLLAWVKNEWLPAIRHDVKFLKMIQTPHEGHTYCVQLVLDSEAAIEAFQQDYLYILQQHIAAHYTEKAFLFDSIMQYLTD